MKLNRWLVLLLAAASSLAQAVSPEPAPLPQKETLTVGFVKVGHVSPIVGIEEALKKMNIEVKRAEFVRYADARTALLSGSVDVSIIGPGDLAIAASQGSNALIGLTGVAGSPKYLVVRKGVTINDWKDSAGKKIGIAPGSAVWFQWAMTLVENNIPYTSFNAVNVQGGGTAQYPEMSCTCPIKTGPAIADVQGGNMHGSCTPPGKKQVWSFFAVAEHLPQQMHDWSRARANTKVTPQQCGASLNLGASFANCFSFACTETTSVNGVRLADCRCPAGENLAGGAVAPATAFSMSAGQGDPSYCGKIPVGAPTP